MKTSLPIVLGCLSILSQPLAAGNVLAPPPTDPPVNQHKVQIALLLDTSSSMSGLINQTKTQLWKVVNTFIDAKRDGVAPYVEVALFEYGNNSIPVGTGYIRQIQPLTRDLDEISRQLFSLSTNGGDEYCGAVIERALGDLTWDKNPRTYKAVFIAGNEPFTQGSVEPMSVCRQARARNIIINTIHCGSHSAGVSGSWNDGAEVGGGKFMIIDQDSQVQHIDAPQDKRISELGTKLNETYIGYGSLRQEGAAKQEKADHDAVANEAAGSHLQRAVCKSSANYSNASWDLVDAIKGKQVDLTKLEKKELPAELQGLTQEQLKAKVDEASKKRASIQQEIQQLNQQREAHVADEMKKLAADGKNTLDRVLVDATRSQAEKLGYEFKK